MSKRIRIHSEALNCYGTWVKTDGVDLTQYKKNPILLYMHRRGEIIGEIREIRVENGEITGEPYFDEVRPESKAAKEQFEKGTLRMASANFEIKAVSSDLTLIKPGQIRPTITKCKLAEVSMVDYGGKDEAIVLTYDGNELKLSAGEESPQLPLINNQTDKAMSKEAEPGATVAPELKQIALALGLEETATVAEIVNAANANRQTADTAKTQMEQVTLSGITGMVEAAIAGRKITADKKDQFIELGKKTGVESLKLMFDSMAVATKPTDVIGAGASLPLAGVSNWTKLSEVPEDKVMELRENDKATYMKLYKAEYGIECVI